MRNKLTVLVYIVLGLAGIGLISQLFGNTKNFIVNIIVTIGIAFVMFTVVYFIFLKKTPGSQSEMKKYRKAVRQSKMKYKPRNTNIIKKKQPTQLKQRKKVNKRPSHLRVIDGKKHNKEKDRATF
ncbi:SA1362 family protein [Virgibacillus sp. W0430]|uniref:SA1362 family protein n=1 Tax=Virgibacillus sp. W0430 TaxID=3391580 RepID=UPI003F46E1DD